VTSDSRIVAAYQSGLPVWAVATHFGLTNGKVRAILVRHDILRNGAHPMKYDEEIVATLLALWTHKRQPTLRQVANIMTRMGIKMTPGAAGGLMWRNDFPKRDLPENFRKAT
jgi:hypothetical protein